MKDRIILYNQQFTKVWGIMLSPLHLEITFQIKLHTSITHLISLYTQGLQNISFGVLHPPLPKINFVLEISSQVSIKL